jgi:hypothetical protein
MVVCRASRLKRISLTAAPVMFVVSDALPRWSPCSQYTSLFCRMPTRAP